MAERVRVCEIDDDEGQRLLRIIRRGSGSVVTWRRAQMVLLSAQGMPVAKIAEVTFTSADRVRDGVLLREEGVSFQRIKTWKTSRDPDYAAKKARVEHLYAIADDEVIPEEGEPEVVLCLDEFGPLNLQPHPGRQWAERGGRHKDPDREPRPRRRATYTRPHGVRHLFAAYDLARDKLYGHVKLKKNRTKFLGFCRYLRTLYPPEIRIAIVLDNFSPHLTTKKDSRVGDWAAANNVELAYTPTNSSWLNRIEAQFTALRYFALDGTDHASHKEQGSMIRRYIIWRNRHAADQRLRGRFVRL
ncbi:transposase [Streptomyces anulatus]|uniref:transposase n=1 Tax=Streptomyces anulatus TaxID=1892 RepID=UPI0038134D6C|nr:transposase [Streptomyces anulatus]WSU87353.1 transposase [Streptomyces anulatus]